MNENVCKYCGQIIIGGAECSCGGARLDKKIQMQKLNARNAINDLFGEGCIAEGYEPLGDEDIEFLKSIAERVAERKVNSVSLIIAGNVRAKFSRGAKGKVKIERSEARSMGTEVEG